MCPRVLTSVRACYSVQTDGNLVLFKTDHYSWLWATHTSHFWNYGPFKVVVAGSFVAGRKPISNRGVNGCQSGNKCDQCMGDCDSDAECKPGLKCFQRDGSQQSDIPGCAMSGQETDYDYCYDPNFNDNMCLYATDGVSRWCSGTTQTATKVEEADPNDKDKKVEKDVPDQVRLVVQDDGDVVLYRQKDGKVLWTTNTVGRKDVSGPMPATLSGGRKQVVLNKESDDGPDVLRIKHEASIEEEKKLLKVKKAEAEAEEAELKTHGIDWRPAEEQTSKKGAQEIESGNTGGAEAEDEAKAITWGADPLSSVPDADEKGSKLGQLQRQAQGGARGRGSQRGVEQKLAPRKVARQESAHQQQQAPGGIQEVIDSLI